MSRLDGVLVTLTPEQWAAPSLCTEWRVRDVVAHIFSYEELSTFGLIGRVLRSGLIPGGLTHRGCRLRRPEPRRADRPGEEQPAAPRGDRRVRRPDRAHRRGDPPAGHPPSRSAYDARCPPQRLAVVLDIAKTAPPIRAAKRIRGLTLTATDLDWTTGQGPLVEGPAEALLMALAGRHGVTGELSGPGLPVLAERIGT